MRDELPEKIVRIIHRNVEPPGRGRKALIYLSPIDTVAPLSVLAARRLLFAQSLEKLLRASGYGVQCRSLFADEDASVHALTVSIWLRYLELCGEAAPYLAGCYQGDYIFDFAATLHRHHAERWRVSAEEVAQFLSQPDTSPERLYDQLKSWIGEEALNTLTPIGLQSLAGDIRNDLRELDISLEHWPRTSELMRNAELASFFAHLTEHGMARTEGETVSLHAPGLPDAVLQNESRPTPLAALLVDFGSAANRAGEQDLLIYVCGSDDSSSSQPVLQCAQRLWNKAVTIKSVAPVHVGDGEELLSTSPLEEDFVSFREARQTVGLRNLRERCAAAPGNEMLTVDLAQAASDEVQNLSGILQPATSEPINTESLSSALQALSAQRCEDAEAMLQAISEFPAVQRQVLQTLEPAQLAQYHRKLCEKFLSYYNKHQLMVRDATRLRETIESQNQAESTVFGAMSAALRRLAECF